MIGCKRRWEMSQKVEEGVLEGEKRGRVRGGAAPARNSRVGEARRGLPTQIGPLSTIRPSRAHPLQCSPPIQPQPRTISSHTTTNLARPQPCKPANMSHAVSRLDLSAVIASKNTSPSTCDSMNSPTNFISLHLAEVQCEQAPSEGTSIITTPRSRSGSRCTPRSNLSSPRTPAGSPKLSNVDLLNVCPECGTWHNSRHSSRGLHSNCNSFPKSHTALPLF